jgi:hypothetical protein
VHESDDGYGEFCQTYLLVNTPPSCLPKSGGPADPFVFRREGALGQLMFAASERGLFLKCHFRLFAVTFSSVTFSSLSTKLVHETLSEELGKNLMDYLFAVSDGASGNGGHRRKPGTDEK